ncbi:MAG: ATP phosphoribosyltransferase, partial [Firmicutes bacterium]|nr:ATP phosphoribosyltransferase [Bacillota bacterium]
QALAGVSGTPEEALAKLQAIGCSEESLVPLREVTESMRGIGEDGGLRIDLSLAGDMNYYNGIVFQGYVKGIPSAVLSGGRYDRLMRRMGKRSDAIGFAVYMDMLERYYADLEESEAQETAAEPAAKDMINIALPKGRMGEKVYRFFAKAGLECPDILEENRKLIFENGDTGVRYFWVKPSDVAVYVERGAADIGVCGKDILLEYEPDVYELLDLKTGICRMSVAGPADFQDDPRRTLRVATKFMNITSDYYAKLGRDIDIIHLNGSIELAPLLELSDVIVDLVETGTTLRENGLKEIETILPVSSRLIANKASFEFKSGAISRICGALAKQVKTDD